jgi:hypothetical protein
LCHSSKKCHCMFNQAFHFKSSSVVPILPRKVRKQCSPTMT